MGVRQKKSVGSCQNFNGQRLRGSPRFENIPALSGRHAAPVRSTSVGDGRGDDGDKSGNGATLAGQRNQ